MSQTKSFTTKSLMSTFVIGIMITALVGNGSFLAILIRSKRLRTLPNTLRANLAIVDLLCALIDMPIVLSNDVLEASRFEEKTFALVKSSLQLGFVILNVLSMVAVMLDRFLAVYIELKYYIWKTKKKKAFLTALLIWLISAFAVLFTTIPVLDIEQASCSFEEYRWLIYMERKPYIIFILVVLMISAVCLGLMTMYAIRQKRKQVKLAIFTS